MLQDVDLLHLKPEHFQDQEQERRVRERMGFGFLDTNALSVAAEKIDIEVRAATTTTANVSLNPRSKALHVNSAIIPPSVCPPSLLSLCPA